MPVAAAIGGAALLGAGSSIYSANKASKTAKKAANANNVLQTQIYDSNKATLAPYVATGNKATSAIEGILGLSKGGNTDWGAYVNGNPDALAQWTNDPTERAKWGNDINAFGQFHYTNDGARRDLAPYTSDTNSGLQSFLDSSNYQFALGEGQKGLSAALGAKGQLDSGAAVKSAIKYNQNTAQGALGSYLGYLGNQQGVGLTAASAQAGVGTNYANAVGANNTSAANTSANASLAAGGAVNGALGSGLSAYSYSQGLGSSYGGGGLNTNLLNSQTSSSLTGITSQGIQANPFQTPWVNY